MTDRKDPAGILLKEFLDARIRDHAPTDYDVLERAQAFFKKSAEEEQRRVTEYSEWIKKEAARHHTESPDFEETIETRLLESPENKFHTVIESVQSQSLPEVYFDKDGSPEPVNRTNARNDKVEQDTSELAADLDQLIAEADAETLETREDEEVEHAES